jgi:cytochrome c55X
VLLSKIKEPDPRQRYKRYIGSRAWRLGALVVALAAAIPARAGETPAAPAAARRAELVRLVRQDCGSCHGLTLKGGLGPALTPEALAGKPAEGLRATILSGRPGTPMPPWRPFLSEAEVEWLVEVLQQGKLEAGR